MTWYERTPPPFNFIFHKYQHFSHEIWMQVKGGFYIRVQVQETWMLKHPLMDLIFGLKIGPKLEVCFLKLGGVFS